MQFLSNYVRNLSQDENISRVVVQVSSKEKARRLLLNIKAYIRTE
jgi:hypothetical protein